jgi:catechol 2,3-dioxygenase-like lactoylglutathione lyase family enzyme
MTSMLEAPVGTEFDSSAVSGLAPSQRLHLVLLGVSDIPRSTAFFTALGWNRVADGNEGFVKFDLGGFALCLINAQALADDALEARGGSGFSGVALIHLARSAEEVPRILAQAANAGGIVTKPATRTAWGVAGYFKDPDGHLFEVDFEETWVFDNEHRLVVDSDPT